jgi:cysteine protease ATG4
MDKSKNDDITDKAFAVFEKSFTVQNPNINSSDNIDLSSWIHITNDQSTPKQTIKINSNVLKINSNITSRLNKHDIYIFHKYFKCIKDFPPEKANQYKRKLQAKLNKIIFFCYRKNFPPISSNKNPKAKYTSDTGWGCMIRCSQMMVARALYKIFKRQKMSASKALYTSLVYFMEFQFTLKNIPDTFIPILNSYLKRICSTNNKIYTIIKSITPPFSIQNLCHIGEIFYKTAGEWFSDVTLSKIYSVINNHFHCFDNISFIPFLTTIVKETIINECFSPISNNNIKKAYTLSNGNVVYFNKACIIFVSVRLGAEKINNVYYDSIKDLFKCKQCLGILGGKNGYAYYFIGCDYKYLFYLDPHVTKNAINSDKERTPANLLEHYLKKDIFQLSLDELQPAFTVGFLIRNLDEFLSLIQWMELHNKREYPVFGLTETNKVINEEYLSEIQLNMNQNDF